MIKENKINNILQKSNYYRSFINKLVIIDKKNKQIISKPFEGSADIFSKNYFNLLTMSILLKKKLYIKITENPYLIKNQKVINKLLNGYYLQLD